MNKEKVTPGQCLSFGGQIADMLFRIGGDKVRVQAALDHRDINVVWGEIESLLARHLIARDEPRQCILTDVAYFQIPEQPEFIAATKFHESNTRVKFSRFSAQFVRDFLPLVRGPAFSMEVIARRLSVQANPVEITAVLGNVPRVLALSQLYWMLEQQPQGEQPDETKHLLVDGSRNVFRILNTQNVECDVSVEWISDGWFVLVYSAEARKTWPANTQFISPKALSMENLIRGWGGFPPREE